MKNKAMNKEKTTLAMNIVALLVIEDIAEETDRTTEDVLLNFMQSKPAESLYNDSLKYWWDGPNSFRETFKDELSKIFKNSEKEL